LIHPSIPSPYSSHSSPKTIYVGTKTPFVSALKRVKQLLTHIDKRATQAVLARSSKRRGRGGRAPPNGAATEALERIEHEPVFVKATGKAVEKALGLATVMMKERDWIVQVRTGSVCAIDDVVVGEGAELEIADVVMGDESESGTKQFNEEDANEIPETRIRFTSMIEIEIRLRTDNAIIT